VEKIDVVKLKSLRLLYC